MCSPAKLSRLLALAAALLDEDDTAEDEAGERMAPGMTAAERDKARHTLLGEYGVGQRMVLPEHRPLGPAAQVPRSTFLG